MKLVDIPKFKLHLSLCRHEEFSLIKTDVPFYSVYWKRYEEEDCYASVIDILNLIFDPVPFIPITIPYDVREAALEIYGEELQKTYQEYKKLQKEKQKLEKLLKK